MLVNREEIAPCVAQRTVPTGSFPSFEFIKGAVDANEQGLEADQNMREALHPIRGFDDVIDDEIISGTR